MHLYHQLSAFKFFTFLAFWLGVACVARAELNPIPLTPESFTHDVIVERTASPPLLPATTASMDTGTNNTGYSFYERGYVLASPTSGLPLAGARFNSDLAMDHEYQLAPNYKNNNAVLLDSSTPSGSLVLTVPGAYQRLSFLTAGGNGNGTVSCQIHHQDGSTEFLSLPCPDWDDTLYPAWTTYGRVEVTAFTFDSVNENRPGIYSTDIVLTNTTSPVVAVDFGFVGGAGPNGIFAVSGSPAAEAPFEPILVAGYNRDVIVEATATRRGILTGATTGSMDNGAANWGWTMYEQGYYPPVATSGLPPAGAVITSLSAADHHYVLPPAYTSNNAVVADVESGWVQLTPQTAVAGSILSFLCASSHGPTTNVCTIYHANGNLETHSFVAPDWLSSEPPALLAHGRVSTDTRVIDRVNSDSPRLFGADVPLANTVSAVTNIEVAFSSGAAGAHTFYFWGQWWERWPGAEPASLVAHPPAGWVAAP